MKTYSITYQYDFEAFLKILNSKLCGQYHIPVNFPNNTLYLNKNNADIIREQIIQYKVRNGPNAYITTLANPVAKWQKCIKYLSGLSILTASLSFCENHDNLPVEEFSSQITLIQKFPPNFILQASRRTFTFLWCLDELQEIAFTINDGFIDRFLEKFEQQYTQKITDKYYFRPIRYYKEHNLCLPTSSSDFLGEIFGTPWHDKLYGYNFEKTEYFLIESKYSEPQTFHIKPYPLEQFFEDVGCTPIIKKMTASQYRNLMKHLLDNIL